MQILGIVIFVVLLTLLVFLICSEVVWTIKRIKKYRDDKKNKNEKKGE